MLLCAMVKSALIQDLFNSSFLRKLSSIVIKFKNKQYFGSAHMSILIRLIEFDKLIRDWKLHTSVLLASRTVAGTICDFLKLKLLFHVQEFLFLILSSCFKALKSSCQFQNALSLSEGKQP